MKGIVEHFEYFILGQGFSHMDRISRLDRIERLIGFRSFKCAGEQLSCKFARNLNVLDTNKHFRFQQGRDVMSKLHNYAAFLLFFQFRLLQVTQASQGVLCVDCFFYRKNLKVGKNFIVGCNQHACFTFSYLLLDTRFGNEVERQNLTWQRFLLVCILIRIFHSFFPSFQFQKMK